MKHTRKHRGGGFQTSQQFFDPAAYPPSAGLFASTPSSAPTASNIRPPMMSTFKGGRRHRRRVTRRLRSRRNTRKN